MKKVFGLLGSSHDVLADLRKGCMENQEEQDFTQGWSTLRIYVVWTHIIMAGWVIYHSAGTSFLGIWVGAYGEIFVPFLAGLPFAFKSALGGFVVFGIVLGLLMRGSGL